jgi:hypothetical protein
MQDLPDAAGDSGAFVFLLLTLVLGGSAAFASGRAIAQTWRPFWHIPLYMLALAAGVRFCHFALFEEPLLSPSGYLLDYATVCAAAALGFRLLRTRQMAGQYGWIFRRIGPLQWRRLA